MKISIIIPRFTIAGVPLAQIRFARALSNKGHKVYLLIGYVEYGYKIPLIEGVEKLNFNKKKVRQMFIPLIKYFFTKKPEIVFSTEDHLNIMVTIAAILSFSSSKISCSSRVTPYDTYSNLVFSKRWFLKYLNKITSWRVNVLTCVSKDMVKQYVDVLKSNRYICVYNIIDNVHSRNMMNELPHHEWLINKKTKIIIAAGKLAYWKGFDNLINSISLLDSEISARLIILGDGPLRSDLELLIKKLNLTDKVSLPGYVQNPLSYFSNSDVFVLSSIVEGLPNVLVEAMMCGCTPVSTDCPTGPREVLHSDKYGYLVPVNDKYAMSKAIDSALKKPISKNLLHEAIKPFHEDAVLKKHFKNLLINSLTHEQ